MSLIYENENIKIEVEESEIPWLKIFTQTPYKEMSEVPSEIKFEIYDLLDIIEKEMLTFHHLQVLQHQQKRFRYHQKLKNVLLVIHNQT